MGLNPITSVYYFFLNINQCPFKAAVSVGYFLSLMQQKSTKEDGTRWENSFEASPDGLQEAAPHEGIVDTSGHIRYNWHFINYSYVSSSAMSSTLFTYFNKSL